MWSLRMWDKLGVAIVLAAVLGASITAAQAFDDSKYPNFKGQWRPIGGPMRFESPGLVDAETGRTSTERLRAFTQDLMNEIARLAQRPYVDELIARGDSDVELGPAEASAS